MSFRRIHQISARYIFISVGSKASPYSFRNETSTFLEAFSTFLFTAAPVGYSYIASIRPSLHLRPNTYPVGQVHKSRYSCFFFRPRKTEDRLGKRKWTDEGLFSNLFNLSRTGRAGELIAFAVLAMIARGKVAN